MPRVTIRDPEPPEGTDGKKEHVVGVVTELRAVAAVCAPHWRQLTARSKR